MYTKIFKMVHYLPELHDYFKFYPCKKLLLEQGSLLTNKVPQMEFTDIEEIAPKILPLQVSNQEESKSGTISGTP